MIHIIVGDTTAIPLTEAVTTFPELAGEVIALKDLLHLGPLAKAEGQTFAETRTTFWNEIITEEKLQQPVPDMERILELSKKMYEDPTLQVWLWMAPWPADVAAYYWLLKYMGKHPGRFFVINIAGLPFLNEKGNVFFPKSLSEILPKELLKARRLARAVTPAEYETDGDEWQKLVTDNAGIRTLDGGKRLTNQPITHYDKLLLSYCTPTFQKASRLINTVFSKNPTVPTGDTFLGWRLREMAKEGTLTLQGNPDKALKDFEICLPGETPTSTETTTPSEAHHA